MRKIGIIFLVTIFFIGIGCLIYAQSQPPAFPWDGTYIREYKFARSTLKITSATKTNFHFKINALSGGNMGAVSGVANITDNTARFEDKRGYFLTFSYEEGKITIEENYEKNTYCGMGVGFMGDYVRKGTEKPEDLGQNYFTHFEIFKGNQEKEFVRLVGDNYKKFTDTGHMFYKEKDLDHFNARVHRMGVRGLFTFLESIIMIRDSDNAIWAAVIDKDKVLYFTNTSDIENIPQTIMDWHKRFEKKPICYVPVE